MEHSDSKAEFQLKPTRQPNDFCTTATEPSIYEMAWALDEGPLKGTFIEYPEKCHCLPYSILCKVKNNEEISDKEAENLRLLYWYAMTSALFGKMIHWGESPFFTVYKRDIER